jgi:hypothetical protein
MRTVVFKNNSLFATAIEHHTQITWCKLCKIYAQLFVLKKQ